MSKTGNLIVFVLGLILFTAGTANAQGFSYSQSSISIGGNGVSIHIEEGSYGSSFGVHINSGRRGNQVGVHIDNRRFNRGPVYRQQPQVIHRQPQVIYQQPQPIQIQIQVLESRQVYEEIYVLDRHGRPCPTGRHRVVWKEVLVTKTAFWDSSYGSYVYYDSNNRLCSYENGGRRHGNRW